MGKQRRAKQARRLLREAKEGLPGQRTQIESILVNLCEIGDEKAAMTIIEEGLRNGAIEVKERPTNK